MNPQRRLPVATLLLIAANVGVAYFTVLHPEFPTEYGFRPDAPSVQNAFESMFIHTNIVHLLGNMLFLAAVGATVEQLSGSLRFIIVYFASGLGGVAAHWLFAAKGADATPLVGASGCIAGCAAYYCIRYLKLRVPMAPKLGVTVFAVTIVWLALQAAGAFIHLGDQGTVTAYWAHLGGFAMGLLLSVSFRAPDVGKLEADQAVLKEMGERSPGAVIAAAEHQLKERPNDLNALQELALMYEQLGEHDKEASVLFKTLEIIADDKQGPLLGRICALGQGSQIPAHRRLALAERFKTSQPDVSKALLKSVLEDDSCEPMHADALLALASLQSEDEPVKSKELLQRLAEKYPVHPATDIARAKGLL